MKHCKNQTCDNDFHPKYKDQAYCSLSCSTGERNRQIRERKEKEYYLKSKLCLELSCQNSISWETRKTNQFCSKPCFAKYENQRRKDIGWSHPSNKHRTPEEIRELTRRRSIGADGPFCLVSFAICKVTGKAFRNNIPNGKSGHIQRSPYVNLDEKTQYYEDAQFKFYVYDYPDEFDLALAEERGWYSTPGSRNGIKNLNGVSRDHLFSVSAGFKLQVDPKIIAHPANCKLMIHTDNKRKEGKCSITLKELFDRIKRWNSKYSSLNRIKDFTV